MYVEEWHFALILAFGFRILDFHPVLFGGRGLYKRAIY